MLILKIFKKRWTKVVCIILCIVLLIVGGSYGYMRYTLSKIKTVSIDKDPNKLGVVPYVNPNDSASTGEPQKNPPDIKNIALIGVDKKNPDGSQRSDSVMIASIDKEHKKIKLTSIMRDTYVAVENDQFAVNGHTRMGHTYQDGGPEMTIKTINTNFKMDITDYIKVDFDGLMDIVDAIGGVKITIKDYEVSEMTAVGITKPGVYNLSGKQALAYSRIRHSGNKDYERTERQREVLQVMFTKMTSLSPTAFASTAQKLFPYVETSLSSSDVLNMGMDVLTSGIRKFEQSRVPFDGMVKETTVDKLYYLTFDTDATVQKLHQFIYEQ